MKLLRCPSIFAISALGLALSLPVRADTPPASPASTPAPSSSDETVILSPFTVTGDSTSGYGASESTTGTRVATKIADLPFVVNVITSEFLNDFDFFDIGDNLGYTSSLTNVDSEGNFVIRGFVATFYLWNGFYRLGVIDRVDIDKIEVIKGPSAAIYGQTVPGGLLNINTKIPTSTPKEDIKFTYGSFDAGRVEAHVNTPGSIGKVKVANLVDFAGYDHTYDIPYAWLHTRTFHDSLKVTLTDRSDLLATVEWTKRLSNTGDAKQGFIFNSATGLLTGQLAPIAEGRFSQGGPNESQNRELTSTDLVYENRITDVFSVRVSGYEYDRHNSENYNGISLDYDPNFLVGGVITPSVVGMSTKAVRTRLDEDGGAGQADLLAHYYMFHHTVENSTLLTLDWSQNWRYRHETQLPSTLNNFPSSVRVNNPNYFTLQPQDDYTVVTRNDKTRWDTDGIFGREQAKLFNGRLILYAGARHDQVTYNFNFGNQFTTKAPFGIAKAGQVQHFVNSAWTLAGGANYKLTHNLALYGNYSQSFQPTAQAQKLGDPELGNTRAWGFDYGIKADFFNDKLQFTAGGYYVLENGLKISVIDPITGASDTISGGSQVSKGLESDFSYSLSNSVDLLGSYGWVNPRLLKQGNNVLANGRRPGNVALENGGLAVKYKFMGTMLKGLSAHAGVIYIGQSYAVVPSSDPIADNIKYPAYYSLDVGLTYKWVQELHGTKFTHSIGVSVDNALNHDYVSVKGDPQPSRGYYISYTIEH